VAVPTRSFHTFEVLSCRWVVERTLAWITSYRRCAGDYERLPAHHEATTQLLPESRASGVLHGHLPGAGVSVGVVRPAA